MKKQIREILNKYRGNQGYTMEHAESELLNLFNEALRWRDAVNDPPKCNDLMQIKYVNIFSDDIIYEHDRYLGDMGMWGIEQSVDIKVLAWRPIK